MVQLFKDKNIYSGWCQEKLASSQAEIQTVTTNFKSQIEELNKSKESELESLSQAKEDEIVKLKEEFKTFEDDLKVLLIDDRNFLKKSFSMYLTFCELLIKSLGKHFA